MIIKEIVTDKGLELGAHMVRAIMTRATGS